MEKNELSYQHTISQHKTLNIFNLCSIKINKIHSFYMSGEVVTVVTNLNEKKFKIKQKPRFWDPHGYCCLKFWENQPNWPEVFSIFYHS